MKVSGEATLHAPVEQVWDALRDPAVLVRTIPGCQRLEAVGDDEYRMTVTAGVASIKGTYQGSVRLTDPQPPTSFVLRAAGSGAPGTVQVEVLVTLAAEGEDVTRLTYDADAVVGGTVGGVGQRMLSGVARKTAGEFFRAVDDVLCNRMEPVVQEPAGANRLGASDAGSPPLVTASSPGPAVFNRPVALTNTPATQTLLLAAAAGAAIALIGVAIGARIARR
ncbi:MAG: carbon monoxide dehydrogenase subunit G [Actinomycetota bacterium]|nr:carbon monoxide dehydrogenase subunit G [Actinomycetota bacterium]